MGGVAVAAAAEDGDGDLGGLVGECIVGEGGCQWDIS